MAERGAAGPHRRGHATDEQVQEAHEESVADQDYITPPATTEWSRLSPDEQARWTVRGQAAIRAWCAHINVTHPELGITKANVILAFQEVEELGASAYTINEGDAYIGRQVVTAIERDPAYADSTLIHEIVGHREFDSGFALSMELYDAAAPSLPGYSRPGDGTPERDAEWERFEYFESEIGALMRESSFWADSRDIDADGTVEANEENPLGAPGALLDTLLRNMADQWAPSLRSPYVTALVRRFEADPRIPDAAMTLLRDTVTRVLGITP